MGLVTIYLHCKRWSFSLKQEPPIVPLSYTAIKAPYPCFIPQRAQPRPPARFTKCTGFHALSINPQCPWTMGAGIKIDARNSCVFMQHKYALSTSAGKSENWYKKPACKPVLGSLESSDRSLLAVREPGCCAIFPERMSWLIWLLGYNVILLLNLVRPGNNRIHVLQCSECAWALQVIALIRGPLYGWGFIKAGTGMWDCAALRTL